MGQRQMIDKSVPVGGCGGPRFLYRLWADNRDLLYIGATYHPRARFREHSKKSYWWPLVCYHVIEEVGEWAVSMSVERRAILDENPVFNVQRYHLTHRYGGKRKI